MTKLEEAMYKAHKESQPVGLDVWVETGVHIKGYVVSDAKAKQEAKKKLIDMIQNNE